MNAGIQIFGFKAGMIIKFSGAIANIPSGFVLCDGNNGTPNLMNRSIIGAGDSYAVGATGGATTHGHTASQGGHTHILISGTDIAAGTDIANLTNSYAPSISVESGSSLSPWYALAFIMKT